jgi:DNA polymerase-1
MSAPDGTPTNAVHGFMMLMKVIGEEKPDGLAVAFDMHAPTFRKDIFDGYKATRKPMPDDLRAQDPIIRELISLMGIPLLECPGFEADDILGTISKSCEAAGQQVVLVTGDRDSFQLAGENTTILYTRKGITDTVRVTPAYIQETYGLQPQQLAFQLIVSGAFPAFHPGVRIDARRFADADIIIDWRAGKQIAQRRKQLGIVAVQPLYQFAALAAEVPALIAVLDLNPLRLLNQLWYGLA